jgi:hypothetical protein
MLIALAASDFLHPVRHALWPLWSELVESMRRPPLIGSKAALERHLRLYPLLAEAISRRGRVLAGSFDLQASAQIAEHDRLAWDLGQAMLASGALAPSMLPLREAAETQGLLRHLVWRLTGRPAHADAPPSAMYAAVQAQLTLRAQQLLDPIEKRNEPPDPPTVLSDLQAIYETESKVILVLDDLAPEEMASRISSTNWSDVAGRLAGEYHGLQVTTARQLPLILERERAADCVLERLRLAWGQDVLAGLSPEPDRVHRDLARLPSKLEIEALPREYIVRSDGELADLIHDFQNRLLNVQLREELFARRAGTPSGAPGGPLPDREAAPMERVNRILQHLGWWAEYYATRISGA